MQMGFCLAHEAVHGKLHRRRRVNEALGILMFALFPGSFHFFEVAHLLHHKRNRSDDELEDYVLPTEIPWQKRVAYYFLICGLFWCLVPLSSIVIAMIPRRSIRIPTPKEDAGVFRRFAQFLNDVSPGRVRRDLLVSGMVWVSAALALHLNLRNELNRIIPKPYFKGDFFKGFYQVMTRFNLTVHPNFPCCRLDPSDRSQTLGSPDSRPMGNPRFDRMPRLAPPTPQQFPSGTSLWAFSCVF